ncbi:peptidylprolyl isomerase [Altererythrobacter sp. KTW20L]|uniref:peptidylprolyl isomerase n=1 Tax=Altererythrobacter sp. KTW20L TaxID=2942210 RepID=UPI0020BD9157|nr:peptidylprolyl isomerase [Altererythrobacter sp. KTW20L]MCL6252099.1 peptidylprolyl isomerase [Altererythrobacter sp. KTW20L]
MLIRFAAAVLALASPALAQEELLPAPAPRTTHVELQTTMGTILIALETERAPITAGNFLRYVEEDRFDGAVFYRAMILDWEPQPNGLIQGGTQYDPDRILPPIAHEPTSVTGLAHVRGALSMARNEPGSATGDFSIMLQAQPAMDANPGNEDPQWHDGYAVFGRVVGGMDVIEAIHAAPRDPDKGEGWMKGEMLAQPVVIVDAVVVELPDQS